MINLYGALRQGGTDAIIVLLGEHPPASEWLKKASIPFEEVTDQTVAQPGWETGLAARYRARVWVNDRLQTDEDHATRIKELGLRLVTFDDVGSGASLADLHVAALAGIRGEHPEGTKVLIGLKYLVLVPEIARYRRQRTRCNSWVVSIGGSDTYGVTVRVAQWLKSRQQPATLILGPGFDHTEMLSKIIGNGITEKRSVPSLAAEFSEHDLAITGGGLTAFEAAAAGLPTVTVANEEWEVPHCHYLQTLGCSVFVGQHGSMDLAVLERPLEIAKMSMAALDVFDVKGIDRVHDEVMSLLN